MAHDTVRVRAEVNKDTYDWFIERYPDSSISATLSMLFDKFKEVSTMTPSDYARVAAEAMREESKI